MDSIAMTTNEGIALNVELVGIKNLKSSHCWRLEFDVPETDAAKVGDLVNKIERAFVMALVEHES